MKARHSLAIVLALAAACSNPQPSNLGGTQDGSVGPDDARPPFDAAVFDVPPRIGNPVAGASGLNYYKFMSLPPTLSTPEMGTQASGSTIVVGIARGDNTKFVIPTDSHGNAPYEQLGTMRPYNSPFADSGTAMYAFANANGGPGFRVTTRTRDDDERDEITMVAVEVIGGTRIQSFEWNIRDQRETITSNRVTTTDAATLVAFWWGDGFPGDVRQEATPHDGFQRIETNAQDTHSFVQVAVAVKNVPSAGTYSVTWTSVPEQGAQLWLIAVQ